MANLADNVVQWINHYVNNHQSAAILIHSAEQNELVVRGAIIEYVAQIENWSHTDPFSTSSYEVACQSLYLKHNVLIKLVQKAMSSPDYSHVDIDISGYNKFFFDLELNASDPYFNRIKRDYYNEVSN